MQVSIENEYMRVTADAKGAELAGIYLKKSQREALWQGKEEGYWNRRAPLLFPHCGRLKDDILRYEGREYRSTQHGFLRDMTFVPEKQLPEEMSFSCNYTEETLEKYPFRFKAVVTYRLEGEKLLSLVTIENVEKTREMYFSMGFHPAVNCPFAEGKTIEDYTLVFEREESPRELIHSLETGYNTGETRTIFENSRRWPLREHMFDADSIAVDNLKSRWVKLEENETGRGILFDIEKFPYVLFWTCMTHPVKYLCVEPWHGINAYQDEKGEFSQKPGVRRLAPGESFEAALGITFVED